jgi:hypothetical protein
MTTTTTSQHPRFHCHECRAWQPATSDVHGYTCDVCGEAILCDECGQPWTDDHTDAARAEAAIASAKAVTRDVQAKLDALGPAKAAR